MSVQSILTVPDVEPWQARAAAVSVTSSAIRDGWERTEQHREVLMMLGLMETPEVAK